VMIRNLLLFRVSLEEKRSEQEIAKPTSTANVMRKLAALGVTVEPSRVHVQVDTIKKRNSI
jgi:hypothetical protein